ncbi:MAG: homoserine kinase [Myxococcales bacterium]|nr:homoserine kinase [Myxococcales bacterium]
MLPVSKCCAQPGPARPPKRRKQPLNSLDNCPRARVFAPASVGNFIVGFDVLGAAIRPASGELLGDIVDISTATLPHLRLVGRWAHAVPAEPGHNLAWLAAQAVARGRGLEQPRWSVVLEKGLPVGSGLGSSSASAVAGAVAAAAWLDGLARLAWPDFERWRADHWLELLDAAGSAEAHAAGAAHLDNVVPCLVGGLQLVHGRTNHRLPWPSDLKLVLCSPQLQLTTKAARAVLPAQLDLGSAVDHSARLATFVHALHTHNSRLLATSLVDTIAEPHRAGLVQGFGAVKSAAAATGAVACSLSGAGPAVLAVAPAGCAPAVADAMAAAFAGFASAATTWVCDIDYQGARQVDSHVTGQ